MLPCSRSESLTKTALIRSFLFQCALPWGVVSGHGAHRYRRQRAARTLPGSPFPVRWAHTRFPPAERFKPKAPATPTHLFEAERHGEDADPHDAVYDVRDQPPFGGGSCGHFEGLGAGTANATLTNPTLAARGPWTGVAEISLQTLPGYAAA